MYSNVTPEIILASASPRRKEILANLGLHFTVIPSAVDETIDSSTSPDRAVEILAERKAAHVARGINYPAIVIGSDTTVVVNNNSLGKPEDQQEAFNMLRQLSGRGHRVITGLTLIHTGTGRTITESVSSQVFFKELTDEEILNYIKTGEPIDKAGAYAIQGLASTFITRIEGCYPNIVGLPIFKLSEMLKTFDIDILAINAARAQ